MISGAERRALYNLTINHHQDGKAIIDAGAFLGASTKTFLLALRQLGFDSSSIHTYEYCKFSQYSAGFASDALGSQHKEGEGFDELLKSLVGDREGLVKYNLGDIKNFEFSGPEISIAFIDVLKGTSLLDVVYNKFFPFFTRDTILYQQDYFHPFHPWIACSMAQHRDIFAYVGRPDPEFGAYNAAAFEVRDLSRLRSASPSRLRDATKEQVFDWMKTAIQMHDHSFEKLNMAGLYGSAVALFDKNKDTSLEEFKNTLVDLGIAYLLDHPKQQHHVNRISLYITVLSNNAMRWSD